MTSTRPGPDELRVRGILRKHGVGPDAEQQPLPPMPTHRPAGYEQRPRDWLDDILDDETHQTPVPAPEPASDEHPPAPRTRHRPAFEPRRTSGAETLAILTPKTRWLLLHTSAAAAGWPIGLIHWGQNTAAWYAAGHWTDSSAWVIYALGALALSLYRCTRHRAPLIAWAAAVPLSSVTCGVLLYGAA